MLTSVVLFNVAMVGFYRRKDFKLMGAMIILSFVSIALIVRMACCGKVKAPESTNDPAIIESIQARSSPGKGAARTPRLGGGAGAGGSPAVTFSADSKTSSSGSSGNSMITKLTLTPTNDLTTPLTGGGGGDGSGGGEAGSSTPSDHALDLNSSVEEPFAPSQQWESTPRHPQTPRSTALTTAMAKKVRNVSVSACA